MPPLHEKLSWTKPPLIVSAPMGGIAGPDLAIAVSRAGGVGLLGNVPPASSAGKWLDEVDEKLASEPVQFSNSNSDELTFLPVGVGFLVSFLKLSDVTGMLVQRKQAGRKSPAMFWLFAAKEPALETYTSWAQELRGIYKGEEHVPSIWIQVGGGPQNVVQIAKSVQPDVVVVQGSDAGGHGIERGASLLGTLPETMDLLHRSGFQSIPHVLASGGIADARGALAALSLGAEGVIMGTRFLASPETLMHDEYRKRILAAKDGAQSTIRAKVFDELKGPSIWPVEYDGRALVSESWRDMHERGVSIETIREGHAQAVKGGHGGYSIDSDRAAIWAGTGVGLVNDIRSAGEIVEVTRDAIFQEATRLQNRLNSMNGKL